MEEVAMLGRYCRYRYTRYCRYCRYYRYHLVEWVWPATTAPDITTLASNSQVNISIGIMWISRRYYVDIT